MHRELSIDDEPLVGRAIALRRLRAFLAEGGRLLTLCGPPGVGKSRIARALFAGEGEARRCDLFGASDAAAIRRRLRAANGGGEMLVVDNLPFVDDEVRALLAERLDADPRLRLFVTSRQVVGLPGERVHELEPLAPGEAVELLRLRASSAGAQPHELDAATLRAIAISLGCLPLALELAAAQLSHLRPAELLARLPARLELLERAPLDAGFGRFHGLREAIDASWKTLGPREASALARFSVFRGGFRSEAAAAVIDPEGGPIEELLRALRARSLLRSVDGRHFLDESIRIYAERMLDPADRIEAERRHAAHYLAEARRWAEAYERRADPGAAAALEREQDNLLEIHRRSLHRTSCAGTAADALQAALALEPILLGRDARALVAALDAALEVATPARADRLLRARALLSRGRARHLVGRPAGALADLAEAVGLARAEGDERLEVLALLHIARVHRVQGRHELALACVEHAVERARGRYDDLFGRALAGRALLARERGALEEARVGYEMAVEALLRSGDRRGWAIAMGELGHLLVDLGRFDEARAHVEAALTVFRELGDAANHATLSCSLADILCERGVLSQACIAYEEAIVLARAAGHRRLEGRIAFALGGALLESGRTDRAQASFEAALTILRSVGDTRGEGMCLLAYAFLLADRGDLARAEDAVSRAERLLRERGDPRGLAAVDAARGSLVLARARQRRALDEPQRAAAPIAEARRRLAVARAGGAAAREAGRLILRLLERTIAAVAARPVEPQAAGAR